MKEAGKPPLMLEFLFGEAAGLAQRSASPRLLRWARAYDEWLAERKRNYDISVYRQSIRAWRRLLSKASKPPWEIARADIEENCLFMKEAGYAPGTIAGELTTLRGFYRWCGERRIDRELPAGFNPAAETPLPETREYAAGKAMSPEEARALLAIYRREGSVFSLRDSALFRARLELGGRFAGLLELRWGQIEQDESGMWVWLGSRGNQPARRRLPDGTWEAIRAYLQAAGRLEGMQAEAYVFAPAAQPYLRELTGKAEDWDESRHLSDRQFTRSLKTYGRLAGIPEAKLNLFALKHTAALLRQEAGDSVEEIRKFLDIPTEQATKKYLRRLNAADQGKKQPEETAEKAPPPETELPKRGVKLFRPGEQTTLQHGFFARRLPQEQVDAVLAEGVQGLGEQIAGLRRLVDGLELLMGAAESSGQAAQLADLYMHTASRRADLIEAEKRLAEQGKEGRWAEELLEGLDRFSLEFGLEPISQAVRREALGDPGDPSSRHLTVAIARSRLILRNLQEFARQALEALNVEGYMRWTGNYGLGCARLVRLLRAQGQGDGRLEAYVWAELEKAIDRQWEELKEADSSYRPRSIDDMSILTYNDVGGS